MGQSNPEQRRGRALEETGVTHFAGADVDFNPIHLCNMNMD